MPNYSYLETPLQCPFCNTLLTELIWFQWGFSPGYSPVDDYIYHLDDEIVWKECKDGSTPPWTYFEEECREIGANLGDPLVKNLIVKDSGQYFLNGPCNACKKLLGGAAIEIENSIIKRAWILLPGELIDEADIFILNTDGSLEPMIEWKDHSMNTVRDC